MRRTLFVFLFISFCGIARSQNLIPNSGFEVCTALPSDVAQWANCPPWTPANDGSPDYLNTNGSGIVALPNSIFGATIPHNGNAVMGLFTDLSQREYLSVQLASAMIPEQAYTVSFWVTNGSGDSYGASTDHLGIYFSNAPMDLPTPEAILVTPQLEIPGQVWSNNWVQYTFTIIATDPWAYFTIGVFAPEAMVTMVEQVPVAPIPSIAYYFFDDIQVMMIPPELAISGDTLICEKESTTLTASNGIDYSWAESSAPSYIIGTGSELTVSPLITTTYFVYSESDTAQITIEVTQIPQVSVTPNPVPAEYPLVHFLVYPNNADATWYFDDGLSIEGTTAQHMYPTNAEDTYPVMLIASQAGCIDTCYLQVVVRNRGVYYVPNAFTPDGSEFNNTFGPVFSSGFDPEEYTLEIYDRWGELVFETQHLSESWDGTFHGLECASGVYTWKIAIGKKKNAEAIELNGFVALLR